MLLLINTCLKNKIILAIEHNGKILEKKCSFKNRQAEKIIKMLGDFFLKNNLNIKKIKGIISVNGPGSFTSVRAGVSASNAISYALNIPAISLKLDQFKNLSDSFNILKSSKQKNIRYIKPFYDKEPNITA